MTDGEPGEEDGTPPAERQNSGEADALSDGAGVAGPDEEEAPTLGDLLDELAAYESGVTDPARRERIRDIIETAEEMEEPAVFGRTVVGFDRSDLAEAFLGSVLFGIPMMVEGGTQEVGQFVARHPSSLAGTLLGAIGLTIGILYVAEIQDVRIRDPILGFIPRRLAAVVGVSFLTAIALSTAWGRVDWSDPWVALSTVVVAFAPMTVGAALGDILPGS
ncbi:MAG: DUF2391 domain-containing protein [Halorientalis sp.]